MAEIFPFKGILYDRKKVTPLEAVMSPPYDVISPQLRDELYKTHVHNIVRIILGKELKGDTARKSKYTRANSFLKEWLKKGVLRQDSKPAVYVYEQEYLNKGQLKKRIGFISLMKIEDPSSSLVLPHEYTFSKPKEDRLNLIRSTNANTSPIFCIFEDEQRRVTAILKEYIRSKKPLIDIHIEGVGHRLWRLTTSPLITEIKREFDKKQVFIADGHHRYEVALRFRDEMQKKLGRRRARKFNKVMVYFSSLTDEGLTIFSTYRVIKTLGKLQWADLEKKLSAYFAVEGISSKEDLFDALEKAQEGYCFGIYFKNRHFYILRLRDEAALDTMIRVDKSREWRKLNVTVLHFLIFDHILHIDKFASNDQNIIYTRDEDYAIHLVDKGDCDIAFFQLPTKVAQVQHIARNGDRMPHKSTYFYPKVLTGLVMNKF